MIVPVRSDLSPNSESNWPDKLQPPLAAPATPQVLRTLVQFEVVVRFA